MGLRPTIEEIRNLGHHAAYFDWGISFVTMPQLISGFSSADLNTRAQSISAPTRSQQSSDVSIRGHKIYQHGIMDYSGTINLKLYETVDTKVGNFFERWLDLQWEPNTGIQVPKNTNQATLLLTLLDSLNHPRKYYTIIGAWPKSFKPDGDFDATNNSVITYTLELQYDYYLDY